MKHLMIIKFLCLMALTGFSQSVEQSVIGSSGDHFADNQTWMSWTIGELVTETTSDNSNILTQGFHQGDLVVSKVEEPDDEIATPEISVFPNPSTQFIYVQFSSTGRDTYRMQVLNLEGKLLYSQKAESGEHQVQLDFSKYAAGAYFLRLDNAQTNETISYQIQKIR